MNQIRGAMCLIGAVLISYLSYLIYPKMYQDAWTSSTTAMMTFVTNEATRQWTAIGMLLAAVVMIVAAVRMIRQPSPPPAYRSPNVD